MEPKRLNKFISDTGFCSRREADQLIAHERVTVNGKTPAAGAKVTSQDKVRIDGQLLHYREEAPVFLVFNKPPGIATTTDRSVRNNILSALNYPAALLPIGFLDRESEGLLFLSNDTELARKMTKADNQYEKEYVVTVDKLVAPGFLARISENDLQDAGMARRKSAVTKEGPSRFRIVLEPGMYHNIKKRCEDLGYKVLHLQRVRIGSITPAKLAPGMWRVVTEAELEGLKSVLSGWSGRGRASASREENYYGEEMPPRRSPARPRPSRAGGSAPATRPGTGKAQSSRGPKSAGDGPASKRPAGAARSSAASRSSAPKGGAKGGAAAGRTRKPTVNKGRNRS
jgi:23S rRNA pseudouridine2604 synthase